jgi:hypothetical protein
MDHGQEKTADTKDMPKRPFPAVPTEYSRSPCASRHTYDRYTLSRRCGDDAVNLTTSLHPRVSTQRRDEERMETIDTAQGSR